MKIDFILIFNHIYPIIILNKLDFIYYNLSIDS